MDESAKGKTMIEYEYRFVKFNGELVQQQRAVKKKVYAKKWWKPWEYTVEREYMKWFTIPIEEIYEFRVGDRVQVRQTAGFHKGATGEVRFVEPRGRVWVLRDNSGSPVYYDNDELELIWRRPSE